MMDHPGEALLPWHDEPLIETRGSAKRLERNCIFARGKLMEGRNQVEQGKHISLAQRVQDLVHARDGQVAEATDEVEVLVVDGDPNAFRLLRNDHQRAPIQRSRVLDKACREVLVQGGVNSLGQRRVDPVRPESDRCATFRDRNLERHKGQEPKSVLDLEKRQQYRREHRPAVRLLMESSPGCAGQTQPRTAVTAIVPRRAGTKRDVPESNAQAGQARVRP